jgi:O-antigen/teichoic acid export membrane protein
MLDLRKSQAVIPEQNEKADEDLTGRNRLVSNVISSWAAHFVFLIAGFIMPRMIDQRLGQDLLGVWDFAWSLVNCFGLVQGGIIGSVNRYVSRYRAVSDMVGVNRTVSSASCILALSGLTALGLTTVASLQLPRLFGTRLGANTIDAQWVVFFLGSCLALEISLGAFAGLLTGYHHWKLHNIIKSGWHAVTVIGMILALILGGSLRSLAVITFVGLALAYLTRVIIVYRVCEGLQVRPSLVGWATIRKLLLFGGKTLMPSISRLLMNQMISILIIFYLGPTMLALFSRPRSLILHINTLVGKMGMVLSPATSSLESLGNMEEIRQLLVKSVRYSLYMVLPMTAVIVCFSDTILELWMGPRYSMRLLPAVLTLGYLTNIVQMPVVHLLGGMNAHGRAGVAYFIASLCSVGSTALVLGYLGWGLAGTALAVTLPLTIMSAVYLPLLICRRVGLDIKQYYLSILTGPVIHVSPLVMCLVGARILFHDDLLVGLMSGSAVGGAILTVLYWRNVLPDQIKDRVFPKHRRRAVVQLPH